MADDTGFGLSTIGQIAVNVQDLDRGVVIVDEPHIIAKMGMYDLWMAFFRDSEGNTHGLMSEVPQR